jgi:hypothetical protein
MHPDTARALVWVSLFLVVIGPLATSRAANFLAPLLAAWRCCHRSRSIRYPRDQHVSRLQL